VVAKVLILKPDTLFFVKLLKHPKYGIAGFPLLREVDTDVCPGTIFTLTVFDKKLYRNFFPYSFNQYRYKRNGLFDLLYIKPEKELLKTYVNIILKENT
jgi:hypothetical protein